jgi:hypothetical protein
MSLLLGYDMFALFDHCGAGADNYQDTGGVDCHAQ